MYAGALGDNAVERYALFLTSLGLSAAPAERRLALTRARAHGLDPARVAIATAERTIERAFDVLPNVLRGPLPALAGGGLRPEKGAEGAEDAEALLVRSIEWTVLMEATYDTALEQANVILRYLLGTPLPLPFYSARCSRVLCGVCSVGREQRRGACRSRRSCWRCCPRSSRRSVRPRSARRSTRTIGSSSPSGPRSSACSRARRARARRRRATRARSGSESTR